MGNIIGNSFDKPIIDQINLRQNVLGNPNIPDEILKWNNANTSWVKLISSVDVNKDDGKLAKDNILFGGTVSYTPPIYEFPGSPANKTSTLSVKGGLKAYNTSSFGRRPMAVIMGADISYLNSNGTLQKALINVKAFSPEQLDIIDKLYMRPGYNILLEWGHTFYLDNSTKSVQTFKSFVTEPFIFITDKTKSPQDILNSIKNETSKYFGNYGAFYGPITKFNWKFNPDEGSYDITIEAISQGHIIESLLLNTSFKKSSESTAVQEKNEDIPAIIAYRDASAFNNFLYDIYILTNRSGQEIQEDLAQQEFVRALAKVNTTAAVQTAIITGEIGTAVEIVGTKIGEFFD